MKKLVAVFGVLFAGFISSSCGDSGEIYKIVNEDALYKVSIERRITNEINPHQVIVSSGFGYNEMTRELLVTCPCYFLHKGYSHSGPVVEIREGELKLKLLPNAAGYGLIVKYPDGIKYELEIP